MSYNQSSLFNLCRLLGLDIKKIPIKHKKIFKTPIDIFENYYEDFVVDIVGSSYDNIEEMNYKIMSIKVSASKPIVVARLINLIKDEPTGKEEAFDLVLIVHNPDSKDPFYVFFDTKSRKEGLFFQNRLVKSPAVNDIVLDKRDQFNQTKTMMGLNNGSRDFMYIYFKTHNVTSYFVEDVNNVVMEFGRNETKEFFGPSFFHLYITLRNSMEFCK